MTPEKLNAIITQLTEHYPQAFSNAPKAVKPLQIGIHSDLYDWAKSQGYSGTALRRALRMYTGRPSYLRALAERQHRVNLKGQDRGRVSKEHAKQARQRLANRKKAKNWKQFLGAKERHQFKMPKRPILGLRSTP